MSYKSQLSGRDPFQRALDLLGVDNGIQDAFRDYVHDSVTPEPIRGLICGLCSQYVSMHDKYTSLVAETGHQRISLEDEVKKRDELIETLQKLALEDHKTGLYNDRAFALNVPKQLSTLHREFTRLSNAGFGHTYDRQLAIAYCDIDYFKIANDTFGHDICDLVLQDVAAVMKENIRFEDSVYRIGGEEIAIVMQANSVEGLESRIETIRSKVFDEVRVQSTVEKKQKRLRKIKQMRAEQMQSGELKRTAGLLPPGYSNDDIERQISISVGLVFFHPAKAQTGQLNVINPTEEKFDPSKEIDRLRSQADTEMYRSKKTGRNMVSRSYTNLPIVRDE